MSRESQHLVADVAAQQSEWIGRLEAQAATQAKQLEAAIEASRAHIDEELSSVTAVSASMSITRR